MKTTNYIRLAIALIGIVLLFFGAKVLAAGLLITQIAYEVLFFFLNEKIDRINEARTKELIEREQLEVRFRQVNKEEYNRFKFE